MLDNTDIVFTLCQLQCGVVCVLLCRPIAFLIHVLNDENNDSKAIAKRQHTESKGNMDELQRLLFVGFRFLEENSRIEFLLEPLVDDAGGLQLEDQLVKDWLPGCVLPAEEGQYFSCCL